MKLAEEYYRDWDGAATTTSPLPRLNTFANAWKNISNCANNDDSQKASPHPYADMHLLRVPLVHVRTTPSSGPPRACVGEQGRFHVQAWMV